MHRLWLTLGACFAFLSVAAGAFGAHVLRDRLEPSLLAVFETAARYQMFHALALLVLGLVSATSPSRATHIAGIAFVTGTLLFSGSLYALATTGNRWLGAITPIGGVAFLVGWAALAVAGASKTP